MRTSASQPDVLERVAVIGLISSAPIEGGYAFPIEVAVGTCVPRRIDAWFIKPDQEWLFWDWDRRAAQERGVRLGLLWREAIPRAELAPHVSAALAGRRVLSLDPATDGVLLRLLLQGHPAPPVEDLVAVCRERAGEDRIGPAALTATETVKRVPQLRGRASGFVLAGLLTLERLFGVGGDA